MKAFIAVLLVAAVSGQMQRGVTDRNVIDLLTYRGLTPRNEIYSNANKMTAYGDLLQKFLPFTGQPEILDALKIVRIPSDVTFSTFTLRQLYSLPLFQEFLQLPLFREYVNAPAFQLYLLSGEFQKFFAQPLFKEFFVEPALFYKYVYPVVQQYQQLAQIYQQQQVNYVKGQSGLVNPLTTFTTLTNGQQVPVMRNNIYTNFLFNKMMNKDFFIPQTQQLTNKYEQIIPQQFTNKYEQIIPQQFTNKYEQIIPQQFTNKYEQIIPQQFTNKYEQIIPQQFTPKYEQIIPQIYTNDLLSKFQEYQRDFVTPQINNKNIFDILVGGQTQKTPIVDTQIGQLPEFGVFTGVKTTNVVLLEKIVKDLIQGKIDINDLKTNFVNIEKVNKIVDPITGDVKIVEEKMMKPVVDTVVDGELVNTMNNLNAVRKEQIIKRNIFNKF